MLKLFLTYNLTSDAIKDFEAQPVEALDCFWHGQGIERSVKNNNRVTNKYFSLEK